VKKQAYSNYHDLLQSSYVQQSINQDPSSEEMTLWYYPLSFFVLFYLLNETSPSNAGLSNVAVDQLEAVTTGVPDRM